MGVRDIEQLFSQPWVGHSWEGFVIEQTLATLAAVGKPAEPLFFRTSDGYELDMVLDWGVERWAVEIKLTSDPSTTMINRLHKTADMIDATKRVLVCRTANPIDSERLLITNLSGWLEKVMQ